MIDRSSLFLEIDPVSLNAFQSVNYTLVSIGSNRNAAFDPLLLVLAAGGLQQNGNFDGK